MAITDIQISEELKTNAPSIKYRGNEGPKSPQEMQQMMVDDALDEAYEQYIFDLLEQRPDATPMSKDEFKRMVIMEGMMGGGNPLPEDPTKPVNPFAPKPTGPVLPNKREMAAYGGIMGVDGRRQYGIGSFFQKLKDKVVDDIIPNEIKDNPELAAAAALVGANYFDVIPGSGSSKGYIGELFKSLPESVKKAPGKVKEFIFEEDDEGKSIAKNIGSSLAKNIVPILGGVTAGLFTKNQPEQPGLPSDTTALNLADLKKGANLATQQQGLASGLNFLPAVAARKFTPEEMAITYAQSAANGGRIGYENAGPVVDEQTTQMILDMNNRGMDVETISTITQQNANTINAILSAQNQKAEGGIMDLGGMEKDYRAEGGFVPIGKEEKADDVPARLSVNEFVFTADAVRNAGGGDIDQGARVMENMMKHLEAGGQVSEESQGMAGARDMFAVSERLSEVV
jgi:uncharacterized short protein YbdD (DUF466 family)